MHQNQIQNQPHQKQHQQPPLMQLAMIDFALPASILDSAPSNVHRAITCHGRVEQSRMELGKS